MYLQPGHYYDLSIQSILGKEVILEHDIRLDQPERKFYQIGEKLHVFLYHNLEDELIATTQTAKACVGDLATLKVVNLKPHGAYLDWGIPKDLFVPRSFHEDDLQEGDLCLVKIIIDNVTGKAIGKEKLEDELSNEELTVKEKEVVDMIVYKDTPLGYQMIINKKHIGLLHFNEVFKDLYAGDVVTGFIKKIKEDKKIDVMIGKPGHSRIETETDPILIMLKENNGFLPYHDKSPADEIYKAFGMSKKTFKMAIGSLYKRKKIVIEPDGIRLVN